MLNGKSGALSDFFFHKIAKSSIKYILKTLHTKTSTAKKFSKSKSHVLDILVIKS